MWWHVRASCCRRGQAAPDRARQTILVIDDSITFREELRLALELASYRVLTASTGEEGLQIAADARPAAIVVAGMLPGIGRRHRRAPNPPRRGTAPDAVPAPHRIGRP
ncbi:MAG: hypothetical protein WDN69_29475 [Aliidongia sp.]